MYTFSIYVMSSWNSSDIQQFSCSQYRFQEFANSVLFSMLQQYLFPRILLEIYFNYVEFNSVFVHNNDVFHQNVKWVELIYSNEIATHFINSVLVSFHIQKKIWKNLVISNWITSSFRKMRFRIETFHQVERSWKSVAYNSWLIIFAGAKAMK